ncbi:MAG: PAS domain-containing sensor histidine kinase [Acidimicrobiales bacterium]
MTSRSRGPGSLDSSSFDCLPDAVVCLDATGTISSANAAAGVLLGRSPAELVGLSCADALAPTSASGRRLLAEGWHPSTRLASVGRIPEQEVRLRRSDGTEVRARVTGRYLREEDGSLAGAVLVLRDGTRRNRAAASGIEIVSTVSHELRSPLTSVKGYTSLLLNRWDRLGDEQKRTMLEQVHHDADRVTRLVTELLDISRLETGRLVLHRQMVDLGAMARAVVDKVRLGYPDLEADVVFPAGFPRTYADPDKVEQILTNLVENAAKYADPKGLRIVGETEPGGDGDERAAVLSVVVIDKGEGIPAGDLARIFTKFFRRAETRPTGSGLGLWISRGLAEAHGGRLVASSTLGRGSRFRFSLPVTTLEDAHRP